MKLIKSSLFCFVLIVFATTSVFAQKKLLKKVGTNLSEATQSRGVQTIAFEEETFQFGSIKQNDIVKHEFKFTNKGKKPLEILNCTASCGCTTPDYPFMPIAVGETAMITVTFNSTHKVGHQKPSVTVVTNGQPKVSKIYMEGIVE